MCFEILLDQLVTTLKSEISPLGHDVAEACDAIVTGYKESKNTDKMVAELASILNGEQKVILEQIRDMGYNIEGKPLQGNSARPFQFMNTKVASVPPLSRYGVGAFFGCHLPTVIDLRCCNPTLSEALFQDVTGLQELYLPSCCGRIPSEFLSHSTIRHFEGLETYLIGPYAFFGCSDLRTVKMGALTGVDDYGFTGCKNLKTDVHFLYTVSYIGKHAFASSGVEEVKCSTLTFLGDRAFEKMPALHRAEINIAEIPPYAFHRSKSLVTGVFPMTKKVGKHAFAGCGMLCSCDLSPEIHLEEYAFYHSGLNFIRLVRPTFSGIGHFELCNALEEIIFGPSPVTIPIRFCHGCSSLKYITTEHAAAPGARAIVNDEVGSLYLEVTEERCQWQFYADGCTESINVEPEDCFLSPVLTSIGAEAFAWCGDLHEIDLWPTRRIGQRAFRHSGIQKVVTRASIGVSAFALCPSLFYAYLPTQVSIPGHCFAACPALGPLKINARDVGPYAFAGCERAVIKLENDKSCYIGSYAFAQTQFSSIRLGSNSHIGSHAFFQARKAVAEATVSIGHFSKVANRAFNESEVTAVILGKNASVGDYAFQRCKSLTRVISGTSKFGQAAFSECKSLEHFLLTRPLMLPTKRSSLWGRKAGRIEMFTRGRLKNIALLSAANLELGADLALDADAKTAFKYFILGLQRKTFNFPPELFLEVVHSYIVRFF